jgi:hypothetical protein
MRRTLEMNSEVSRTRIRIGSKGIAKEEFIINDQNYILQDGQVTASIQTFLCVFYHS